jgi:hypothetical protein
MQNVTIPLPLTRVGLLMRAPAADLSVWLAQAGSAQVWHCIAWVGIGAGMYGAAVGIWRAPLQAAFVALKLPLILLLTSFGNALLNAMLAPLLGLNINLRQAFLAVLMSFSIAAAILASLSPLAAFLVWNVPAMSASMGHTRSAHSLILLAHVMAIAFAGVAANLRLVGLLQVLSGSKSVARRVLFAWLIGNLFFGSQLGWILRPFIGSPALPVQFLRQDAFRGNFYETVFHAFVRTIT